jgi:hypothetical protein
VKAYIPGGAGLVGLNLIAQFQHHHKDWELLMVDKKAEAVAIARELFPRVRFLCEDLTRVEGHRWPDAIRGSDACVMLQTRRPVTNNFWTNVNDAPFRDSRCDRDEKSASPAQPCKLHPLLYRR